MSFPVYIHVGSLTFHPHWIFELLAYSIGFCLYVTLRRHQGDKLNDVDRWWIIAAAAVGAVIGSKFLYWLEDPRLTLQHWEDPAFLLGGKTIVGGLIGALLSVECAKKYLRISVRTGDLFAVPLCVGIAVGRIGCFLTGLDDHTFGIATWLPWGFDFGDGINRHPVQLYEIAFVLLLGAILSFCQQHPFQEGTIFRTFMIAYFSFRLVCDILKPDVRVFAGLSSIQWACVGMLLYYAHDSTNWTSPEPEVSRLRLLTK